jgi:hypothetical protein
MPQESYSRSHPGLIAERVGLFSRTSVTFLILDLCGLARTLPKPLLGGRKMKGWESRENRKTYFRSFAFHRYDGRE